MILQVSLDLLNHFLILGIAEVHIAGIHLERAAVVGTVHILRSQVKMQVRQLVAIGAIIDFLRVESLLHGTRHSGHIGHKGVTLLVRELVEVVHVVLVGHKAAAAIGLLLEKESARDGQLANLNHQVRKRLVVCAVKAQLGVTLHSFTGCY